VIWVGAVAAELCGFCDSVRTTTGHQCDTNVTSFVSGKYLNVV